MKKTAVIKLLIGLVLACPLFTRAQQQGALTEDEVKKANNPLANSKAINFQNYYTPTIYESADLKSNAFLIRYAMPFDEGKVLLRVTMPFVTAPTGFDQNGAKYSSGTGDLNFFATYTFSKPGAKTMLGVGPQFAFPTASSNNTGSGKFQVGGAFIAFNASSLSLQWGALITYMASVAGQSDRPNTSVLQMQPFALFQLGKGTYLRSTALCNFNIEASAYNVPIGIGIGQVAKSGGLVFNIFLEPQFTLLHQGYGQPALQVFGGINCQF